jgi:LPS sulfotransferase NodH
MNIPADRTITIVSGLPRSGTSLMMQMLVAGGLTALTDGERVADTDNPRGYHEWERIKSLPRDPNCIDEAQGKLVKVISQLLFALPDGRDYRVIFMERPLQEVVASQAEMIRRRGTSAAGIGTEALTAALQAHLNQVSAWLRNQPIPICRVAYQQVIRDPEGTAKALQEFLKCPMNLEKMLEQVQPSLHRQRSA